MKINFPKLRFKEFTDEWRFCPMDSIAKIDTGSKDTQDKVDSGVYPFFVRSNKVERIDTYSYDGVAILTSGDGVGVGRNFHYMNGKFNYHQRVYAIKEFSNGINSKFIYQYFAEKFYNRVIRTSAKNSVDSVRMEMIAKMPIPCPKIEEQQKIADFLGAVDEKIEKLEEKKKAFEKYKKGVMQAIFPSKSGQEPKIRFKKLDSSNYPDWEEKQLGEIAKFYKGVGISKDEISENGTIECIRYGELYTSYKELINNIESKTNLNPSKLFLSKSNDVIIPSSGETNIDIATASCVLANNVALGGDLNVIRSKANGIFLSYYLNNRKRFEIAKLAQGNSVVHLYSSQLKNLMLDLPSKEEQEKIAEFLTALDNKINLINNRLELTRLFKKYLMQKMFV